FLQRALLFLTENGCIVQLQRSAYLSGDLAQRSIHQREQCRVLRDAEVSRIVAHAQALDAEATWRTQTNRGKFERDRVAALQAFDEAQFFELVAHVFLEDQGNGQNAELAARGELNRRSSNAAVAILEGEPKTVARAETRTRVHVLQVL